MGDRYVDTLARLVALRPTRRRTLTTILSSALALALGVENTSAQCRRSGQTCGGGAGTCCSGLRCCQGRCRNLQTDPKNCNACGRACKTGELCRSGVCCVTQQIIVPAFAWNSNDWAKLPQNAPPVRIAVLDKADLDQADPNVTNPPDPTWLGTRVALHPTLLVLGYVSTRAGARPEPEIKAEVDRWYRLAPKTADGKSKLDGIFFDEGPIYDNCSPCDRQLDCFGGTAVRDLYRRLYTYVKTQNTVPSARPRRVVLNGAGGFRVEAGAWMFGSNPASTTAVNDGRIADTIVLWEETAAKWLDQQGCGPNNAFPCYVPRPWVQALPRQRVAHVVHTCPSADMAASVQQSRRRGAAYVYVYDGNSTNYGRPPSYIAAEVAEAAACRAPGAPPTPGPTCPA